MTDTTLDDQMGLFGPVEAPEPAEQPTWSLEPLTAREKDMLLLEQKWFRYPGAKEQTIRDKWDLSATQYYQAVNVLIDKEAALAFDPITVKRLRRQRGQRARSRSVRRLGIDL